MARKTRTLIVLFATSVLVAACGGSGKTVRAPSGKFTVTLDDYFIRPQVLRVPSGNLTITVVNKGRLGHTLRIRTKTGHNVRAFTTIEPGASATRTAKLTRGTYTMYCVLANHEELGMYGTLQVG
jgi:plastocyanin